MSRVWNNPSISVTENVGYWEYLCCSTGFTGGGSLALFLETDSNTKARDLTSVILNGTVRNQHWFQRGCMEGYRFPNRPPSNVSVGDGCRKSRENLHQLQCREHLTAKNRAVGVHPPVLGDCSTPRLCSCKFQSANWEKQWINYSIASLREYYQPLKWPHHWRAGKKNPKGIAGKKSVSSKEVSSSLIPQNLKMFLLNIPVIWTSTII